MSTSLKMAALAAAVSVSALLAGSASIGAPGAQRVDDFQLADQNYLGRHLYTMKDDKAVVLISYAAGDATIRKDAAAYKALQTAYAGKHVDFLMIDSKLGETRATVAPDAAASGLDMPILFDYQQLIGEGLGLTRAAEVLVIDPRNWTVAFRGPVGSASTKRALDALESGQNASLSSQAPQGGVIAFPLRAEAGKKATDISYARDVAPIIQAKCTGCHQPGGIAPMGLDNYTQIKGAAPMIREVIRTQRMPPYGVDQTVGHFKDDDSLTGDQIKTLVHWVEAGAPRGAGDDPLAKIAFQAPEWPLGKPDVILDIPAADIPATGVLDYQRPSVRNDMPEGRWMRATTFKISDRQVVHHILTTVVPGMAVPGQTVSESSPGGVSIGGYGPGRLSNLTPPDMGVWIPAHSTVSFQTHYTPYGKATTEKTQMGIYFYAKGEEPKYPMRTFGVFDFGIQIPAGEEFHPEIAYIDIPKDAIIYGLTPHAHHRGGSAQVSIKYPDGHEQMLLSLPKYNFNWQYEYFLAEPLNAPAGSRIITRWTYDNSARNADNPDPTKNIAWGEQSTDEMLALYIHYRWAGETVANLHDDYDRLLSQGQLMGALDDNMDGKLQLSELRGTQAARLKTAFAVLDTNHDGGLDAAEIAAASAPRGGGGAGRGAPQASVTPATRTN